MNFKNITLANGSFSAVSNIMVDKILELRDADAALLYLYILRHPDYFSEEKAKAELGFDSIKLERAVHTLISLEVVKLPTKAKSTEPKITPPKSLYTMNELRDARKDNSEFFAVCATAESVIGKVLSEAQLRLLYTAFDQLKLPADVLIELLTYIKSKNDNITKKDMENEIYLWADMGIFDCDAAASYIKRTELLAPIKRGIASALKIGGRELTSREHGYITRIIDMGFDEKATELIYDKAYAEIGKFSWNYVLRKFQTFHEKGLHTESEILSQDLSYKASKPAYTKEQPSSDNLTDWEKQWISELNSRTKE